MDSTIVEINCFDYYSSLFMDKFYDDLEKHKKYKVTRLNYLNTIVDLFIDDVTVRLNVTDERGRHDIDVCVVGGWIGPMFTSSFIDNVTKRVSFCKNRHPTAPVIITCRDAEAKYKPHEVKEAELHGIKIFNRQMGNQLANEVGAVKYLECSLKTGRGVKLVIDEIVYAGLRKLKDKDEEQAKPKNCRIL